MKRESLIKTLKALLPDGVEVTEETLSAADVALKSNAAVVKYVRGNPTVERVKVISSDGPPTSKLVICAGAPRAVLIGVVVDDKLIIGWSKRNEEADLVWDKAFKALLEAKNNQETDFYRAAERFAKNCKLKDRESAFSKQIGRYLAFILAANETLTFKGKNVYSTRCGLMPDVVASFLPRFLARAEKVCGKTAFNVKK